MSEMVERVARATYEARPYGDEHAGDLIWDRLEDGWKDRHRDMARAAIEAMRRPTEAMVKAGVPDFASHNDDFDPMETAIHNVYVSMIDAALSPETGK